MSEQYFLARKLGLGKEVVSHSLVGRWNEMLKTGSGYRLTSLLTASIEDVCCDGWPAHDRCTTEQPWRHVCGMLNDIEDETHRTFHGHRKSLGGD